jgi:hypothetical protein
MKSGRQRRTEILMRRKAKQAAKRAKKISAQFESATFWQLSQTGGAVQVNPVNLQPDNSYGVPEFVKRGFYVDMPFCCKHCGMPQIWTAQQQRWWYEGVKGNVWQIAVLCRPCRIKERERKTLARKTYIEGLLKKLSRL